MQVRYFAPIVLIWFWIVLRRKRLQRKSTEVLQSAIREGLTEPDSLHPVIDPIVCIGCRACIEACPEQSTYTVLGLVRGKAELVSPSHCIGHGACKTACPVDAITLVFGTIRRGVDIPQVGPDFQTNVPGIFIAGELGGMGLIRNAVEQGRQCIRPIARLARANPQNDALDVMIVGAGPAGIAATLGAEEEGLRYATIEQDSLGGSVAHYPRGKLVMTHPATLPLVGKFRFRETSKEQLIEFWQDVERKTAIEIRYHERLEDIQPNGQGFVVTTNRHSYRTKTIVLAVGRRGTPRKLNVPGEELDKVVYRLIDAAQYRGSHVLVVGGGNSAMEAAISVAAESGTTVTLSYRSDKLSRGNATNINKVAEAAAIGRLSVLLNSNVKAIEPDTVLIEQSEQLNRLRNDAVIVCAGGELPAPMLRKIGIAVDTKHGTT